MKDIRPRILLVEDDDAVRRSLQLLLQSQGYDVWAYSSSEGLALEHNALQAECLIADLMMPTTDAIELLRQLRAAGWKGTSILISGYMDSAWEAKALDAGFVAVLAKPFSESVLLRTLSELWRPPLLKQ